MAVVRILFRSELRQRWQSWLLLAILIALVSGLALAGVAAGRRTAGAFPRYLATHGYDAQVYSAEPISAVASLPEVKQVMPALVPGNDPPVCKECRLLANQDFGVTDLAPPALARHVKLVSGRMPDQSNPNEVLASYTMKRDLGIRLGSPVSIRFASPAQRSAALNGEAIKADGPRYSFKVVGIEASEDEFPAANGTSYALYTTQAFARAMQHRTFFFHLDYVRLRHGAADFPQFQAAARKVGPVGTVDFDSAAAAVNSSIRPLAVGWWILAGLTALVGLVVLAQAFGRQSSLEEDSYATLRALGVSGPQLMLMVMARTAAIAATGVAAGLLLAYGLSNVTLVGEARLADPAAGFSFDASALLLGGLISLAVVLLLGLRPAVAVTRARRGQSRMPRPSRTVALLAGMSAPPVP